MTSTINDNGVITCILRFAKISRLPTQAWKPDEIQWLLTIIIQSSNLISQDIIAIQIPLHQDPRLFTSVQ